MLEVQNQALFFSISHIGRDSFLQRKSASLLVGQNKKFFHQRSKFPSLWAHWCFQKLFSFMSNVPSQLLVFLCLSAVDTQHASDWLRELGADVGSVTGLCQQRVLIRTDYSQLVSEEFFSLTLLSSSLVSSPSSSGSEHTFWKDVPSSFLDIVLFSASFTFWGVFF